MVTLTSTGEPWLPPGFSEALTLPMALAGSLRLTPEEFAEVCEANPDAVLELGGTLEALTCARSCWISSC